MTRHHLAIILATSAAAYSAASGCGAVLGIHDAELYQPDAGPEGKGGSGGSGGAPAKTCSSPSDCPKGDACSKPICLSEQCGVAFAVSGTDCPGPAGEAHVCDGDGNCVECISNAECAAHHPDALICDLAAHKCVGCTDGIQNGQETGLDCGGPDCGGCAGKSCHPELGCADSALCATPENLCCKTACGQKCEACSKARTGQPDGECAPVIVGQDPEGECTTLGGCGATAGKCRCEDGVKNGDETDVDCGGATCAPCGGGKGCVVSEDCSAAFPACADGVCCTSICQAECAACDAGGVCGYVVAGVYDPYCGSMKTCGANGAGCVGTAGAPCSSNSQCLSGACIGGHCAKGALGKPCNTTGDCVSGSCQSYVCQ